MVTRSTRSQESIAGFLLRGLFASAGTTAIFALLAVLAWDILRRPLFTQILLPAVTQVSGGMVHPWLFVFIPAGIFLTHMIYAWVTGTLQDARQTTSQGPESGSSPLLVWGFSGLSMALAINVVGMTWLPALALSSGLAFALHAYTFLIAPLWQRSPEVHPRPRHNLNRLQKPPGDRKKVAPLKQSNEEIPVLPTSKPLQFSRPRPRLQRQRGGYNYEEMMRPAVFSP